jgi:GT2 family glycosyltransferase
VNDETISVAISTLDRPEGLRRCLDALLAGSVLPDELVVVDQGDGARTEAVLSELVTAAPAVVHVKQARRGLSASRNAAFRAASSEVVAVTDDDCVPDASWIAELKNAFGETDAPDAVCGRVLPRGPAGAGRVAVSSRTSQVRREFTGNALPWAVGTGANFAARRELVQAVGGYDERLGVGSAGGAGEDLDIVRRLLRRGARIRYEPGSLVYHERQSPDRRRSTRSSYGRGVGACFALWLRERDPFALRALSAWVAMRLRLLALAAARRDRGGVREELMVLGGTLAGLAYGLRAR